MESVFVVPRARLFPEWTPHGLSIFGDGIERADFDAVIQREGFFVERGYAERTPELKQLIPYTIVRRGDEVLLLRRTAAGGEVRLHDKLSIGVGGHVNPVDARLPDGAPLPEIDGVPVNPKFARLLDPLPAATRREVIEEELEVTGPVRLSPIGLMNDDTTPVGAVHVGLVQVLDLEGGDARVREVDQLEGTFVSVEELEGQLAAGANFETWSALLVPQLDRIWTLAGGASGIAIEHERTVTSRGRRPAHRADSANNMQPQA